MIHDFDTLITYQAHSITVHLSLITATIPRIHGFLVTLQTGRTAARIEVPGFRPIAGRVRSYLDKARIDSTLARSTVHGDYTGTDGHSMRLVPDYEVQLSTRIYSSHSGASETNLTTGSSEGRSQLSEHRVERTRNMSSLKHNSISQRREITVDVEYLNEDEGRSQHNSTI